MTKYQKRLARNEMTRKQNQKKYDLLEKQPQRFVLTGYKLQPKAPHDK